jgi:hypothetical protein
LKTVAAGHMLPDWIAVLAKQSSTWGVPFLDRFESPFVLPLPAFSMTDLSLRRCPRWRRTGHCLCPTSSHRPETVCAKARGHFF